MSYNYASSVPREGNHDVFTSNTLTPISNTDFYDNGQPNPAAVELGKFLFFDKILSGNKNISCATCHHPDHATGDALSLSVGEGGQGLGPLRNIGFNQDRISSRVPRNSPPLFNLGLKQFQTFFHDGRLSIETNAPSGYENPAGTQLPYGLVNLLAAQAMFPVTSAVEMAGQPGENPIADAAAQNNLNGPNGVWPLLAQRLQSIPEYVDLFASAYGITKADISFVHAANAIAAYENVAFRADNSPFDEFLRGNKDAMTRQAQYGMTLFYTTAGCAQCHAGTLQTDQNFYAIAIPQIGPGKGDSALKQDDYGRERVTGNIDDRYKFRTPSLRNVELTAPYGHSGAYSRLEDVISHHLRPEFYVMWYDCDQKSVLPEHPDLDDQDCKLANDYKHIQTLQRFNELSDSYLSNRDFAAIFAFLKALTDERSLNLREWMPSYVPSGLPVHDE